MPRTSASLGKHALLSADDGLRPRESNFVNGESSSRWEHPPEISQLFALHDAFLAGYIVAAIIERFDGLFADGTNEAIRNGGKAAMTTREFVPYLSVTGAEEAVAFYSHVFETEPVLLLNMPDGRVMHCEFRVGGGRFFLSEELPEHGGTPSPASLGATTVAIHLYVDDCDAMVARMKSNGAKVVMEPTDMFWGERFARVRDPFGHEWGIATHLRDMTLTEIQAAAAKQFESMAE